MEASTKIFVSLCDCRVRSSRTNDGFREASLKFPCGFPGWLAEGAVHAGFVTAVFYIGKNSLFNSLRRELDKFGQPSKMATSLLPRTRLYPLIGGSSASSGT